MLQHVSNKQDERNEIVKLYKKDVVKSYKEGSNLGELCRTYHLDISSVLYILQKQKIKKRLLYEVYENQTARNETKKPDLILERDKYYLEKFFPVLNLSFSTSYYWFWREKYRESQDIKAICEHKIRHIRCGICNKILKDATNIILEEPVITMKYVETEETMDEEV